MNIYMTSSFITMLLLLSEIEPQSSVRKINFGIRHKAGTLVEALKVFAVSKLISFEFIIMVATIIILLLLDSSTA